MLVRYLVQSVTDNTLGSSGEGKPMGRQRVVTLNAQGTDVAGVSASGQLQLVTQGGELDGYAVNQVVTREAPGLAA